MNNYEVAKCEKCGHVQVTSESGTVKVAGWEELRQVADMLKTMSIDEVAQQYCSYCLFPIASHPTREEHEKHPDWLSYHEPTPQEGANRFV